MWHRGLAEQLSLLCDSFVSDRLLDVRNFMINNKKIAELAFLNVFSLPVAVLRHPMIFNLIRWATWSLG